MDEKAIAIELGLVLRAERTALGLSQDGFADRIEMHRAYYSAIERGEKNMTLETLLRVAKGLGIVPSILLQSAGF